jgi:hypothetical protein
VLPLDLINFSNPVYSIKGQSEISRDSTYFKDLKIAKKLSFEIFNLLKDRILIFSAILPIFDKNSSLSQ